MGQKRTFHASPALARILLDVRQFPLLFKKFRLWPIEAEHKLELAGGVRRNPVCLLTDRRFRTDIKVNRSVRILFHLGRAAERMYSNCSWIVMT
jgi:hypothetical protein